ncbi:potassium transporter [Oceanithermus profundus DSM 14977]|uniref:Probable potassium transport system protein Kup n=1 Tax=Oceanithermus profundus (strain DSM 14977 / NBRC 100410 / VKM B-2274 / 506) TaxID=670487 RepID=E4UAF9_OCEP5|nr:potassium transporter Kup [Oceanithermus profundus]ADR37664.1 potassium transporter [Oceanithermus profundus DSM 14977]
MADPVHTKTEPNGRYLIALSVAALGVVFGDIGTSPLYAVREAFGEHYGLALTEANVLGVLSLIFWSLVVVISLKYLTLVMRADNHGEGGIMALTALVMPSKLRRGHWRYLAVMLGLFGASLLYGDGMITPAISVLSAVEGLEVAAPRLEPFVIPVTVGILLALFLFQSRGTQRVGGLFGPVTLIWFTAIAALGLAQIVRNPYVLTALNPYHAVHFFTANGATGFWVLGSVFLVVTGGEALYADMGHFGRTPIRLTWFFVVLPALLLNYFGQGALLLANPAAVENPFYLMVPGWATYPMIALATAATIIASQAVISGSFSLTRQAMRLGFLPRMTVVQTSSQEIGQVYIPTINWILMFATVGLVLGFGSSSRLAAAYGVGVTTDMVFTTLLFAVVAWSLWKWPRWAVALLTLVLLGVDLSFWAANIVKVPQGGWFPLVVGAVMLVVMTTWHQGRALLSSVLQKDAFPLERFLETLAASKNPPTRVPGTAVYLTRNPDVVPPALLSNLRYNHAVHENVIVVSVETEEIPRVLGSLRAEVRALDLGFTRVVLHYGFMEHPNVPVALYDIAELELDPDNTYFVLGREIVLPEGKLGMPRWREQLFAVLQRNALPATAFFDLPPAQTFEVGHLIRL